MGLCDLALPIVAATCRARFPFGALATRASDTAARTFSICSSGTRRDCAKDAGFLDNKACGVSIAAGNKRMRRFLRGSVVVDLHDGICVTHAPMLVAVLATVDEPRSTAASAWWMAMVEAARSHRRLMRSSSTRHCGRPATRPLSLCGHFTTYSTRQFAATIVHVTLHPMPKQQLSAISLANSSVWFQFVSMRLYYCIRRCSVYHGCISTSKF
jgi:hypothetical protein